MERWERKAAQAVNAARSIVRDEQLRLLSLRRPDEEDGGRAEEVDEIMSLLTEVKAHIDPHRVVVWEYQTPLPF